MSSETRCSDKHWFGRAATERTPKSRSMMLRFCSYFRHSTTRSTLFSMFIIAFIIITYHIQILSCVQVDNDRSISPIQVKNWATSFGAEIYLACSQLSNLEDIKRNLHKESPKINIRHPESILREMKRDVEYFLKSKIQAVQRIAEEAEKRSKMHEFKKGLKFDYNNSKKIVPIYTKNENGYNEDENEEESSSAEQPEVPEGHVVMRLTKNKHFRNIPVNTKTTTVHVPVNVYDKADNVINAIKWSADLQQNFVDNYERDPSLTWQYFASSTGFMRHHPGLMWKDNNPDLFDSRLRNWYINAAASPKDVVILLDNSGSMAGLRKEIAKHVVRSLLDTLSDNDYVSVMNFSKTTNPLVPCFGEELVQANMENVRAFKSHLNNIETHVIANFNGSLTKAFHILSKSIKRRGYTSGCNQAIMVITDGAPYTYEEVFRRYNWPNATVRIFTYLIGREVTERREVNWMACANRGYFSHVTTLSEVREQVLKYIPVMARPLVLSRYRPATWTPVYADIVDPKMTDYWWNSRIKKRTRRVVEFYNAPYNDYSAAPVSEEALPNQGLGNDMDDGMMPLPLPDDYYLSDDYQPIENDEPRDGFSSVEGLKFMTTVSMPVLDSKTNLVRVANLLGVAGTDVPIAEIKKLLTPYKLGVNGYSFAITNNGFVLFHPDHRPLFDDILKPNYNSVDLSEVELVSAQPTEPRKFSETLLKMRKDMINGATGKVEMEVFVHMDKMKRVTTRTNHYYFTKIEETPFSLGIALPENYGVYEVESKVNVLSTGVKGYMSYFTQNWTVHPDWVYCQFHNHSEPDVSRTEFIRNILNTENVLENGQFWQNKYFPMVRVKPPLDKDSFGTMSQKQYKEIFCDPDLVGMLIFDAHKTYVKDPKNKKPLNIYYGDNETRINNGVTSTFVGTRSGFTRYKQYSDKYPNENYTAPPDKIPNRAVDEMYYKQAVDFYYHNKSAFVFSVPFDAVRRNASDLRVTGSHAIFVNQNNMETPWGVVGVNMKHNVFASRFFNITSQCFKDCRMNCSKASNRCYLLDNNGYVVVSSDHSDTGRFFGEVDINLMKALTEYEVYREIEVYDYQGVCLDVLSTPSDANFLLTPFRHLKSVFTMMWSRLFVWFVESNLFGYFTETMSTETYYNNIKVPTKTRPKPCDKKIKLYQFQKKASIDAVSGKIAQCHSSRCSRQFVATLVPRTNLVLFVVNMECPCTPVMLRHEPEEIFYNGTDMVCHQSKHRMYRTHPNWTCVSSHPQEFEIKECGRSNKLSVSLILIVVGIVTSSSVQMR